MIKFFTFTIIMLLIYTGYAQNPDSVDTEKDLKILMELAVSFGGEDFGTAAITVSEDQEIQSGTGFTFTLGIDQKLPVKNLGLKAGLGYKAAFNEVSEANIKKTVFPLDIIPYYYHLSHKLGAGLIYHINPEMDWDTLGPKWKFDNALGYTLEYSYVLSSAQFSLAYSFIEYSNASSLTFNADHVSFKLGLLL